MSMVHRLISLLLAVALFGAMGQSAAFAAKAADPAMQSMHMTMSMADCMRMMEQASTDKAKPAKHKGCTPADCFNFMTACSGLAAAPVDDATPSLFAARYRSTQLAAIETPLRGQSRLPDIRPPIA